MSYSWKNIRENLNCVWVRVCNLLAGETLRLKCSLIECRLEIVHIWILYELKIETNETGASSPFGIDSMWSAALCTLGVTKPAWGCTCLNFRQGLALVWYKSSADTWIAHAYQSIIPFNFIFIFGVPIHWI